MNDHLPHPSSAQQSSILVILTLQCHKQDVWITRLVDALQSHLLVDSQQKQQQQQHHLPIVTPRPTTSSQQPIVTTFTEKNNDSHSNCNCSRRGRCSCDRKKYQKYNRSKWISIHEIQVIALETLLENKSMIMIGTEKKIGDHWCGLINRVSDAVPPMLHKQCIAFLQSCITIFQIPVWNGATSLTLCSNKWCHHLLFAKAGLHTPEPTLCYYEPTLQQIQKDLHSIQTKDELIDRSNTTTTTTTTTTIATTTSITGSDDIDDNDTATSTTTTAGPFLLKPNAGGFGSGILQFHSVSELDHQQLLVQNKDRMVLLQPYIQPQQNRIYRVWFCQGKVQCGVFRELQPSRHNNNNMDLWKNGCMSGYCHRNDIKATATPPFRRNSDDRDNVDQAESQVRLVAYHIPDGVQAEIENDLLPLLDDCHSGSVEYLIEENNTHRRLYFDLNMLSTLPLPEHMTDTSA